MSISYDDNDYTVDELISNVFLWIPLQTLDAVQRANQEQWPIGMDGNRESKESVLSAYLDDDEEEEEMQTFPVQIWI